MISEQATSTPSSLLERWQRIKDVKGTDCCLIGKSIFVGEWEHYPILYKSHLTEEIEELVLYGRATIDSTDKDRVTTCKINTIYLFEKGRLDCSNTVLVARRIIRMTRKQFADAVEKIKSIEPTDPHLVPEKRFRYPCFSISMERAEGHDYQGLATSLEFKDEGFVRLFMTAEQNPATGFRVPLEQAVVRDDTETVRRLLEAKALPADSLTTAALCNSTESAKLLITARAGLNDKDYRGDTPLSGAVASCSLEVLNLLVGAGADLTAHQPKPEQMSAMLFHAVGNGLLPALESLLSNGCSLEAENIAHDTPLTVAAKYGHRDMVAFLLSKEASIDAKGQEGTALDLAMQQRRADIVSLLFNEDPLFALEWLTKLAKKDRDKLQLFLKERLLCETRAGQPIRAGGKALMQAAYSGNYEITKALVEAGADLSVRERGTTVLALVRSTLQMMSREGESPLFSKGPKGVARKEEYDQLKGNYAEIISLLEQHGAPEEIDHTPQRLPLQQAKSVAFIPGNVAEEIKPEKTMEDASKLIDDITNLISQCEIDYPIAELFTFPAARQRRRAKDISGKKPRRVPRSRQE